MTQRAPVGADRRVDPISPSRASFAQSSPASQRPCYHPTFYRSLQRLLHFNFYDAAPHTHMCEAVELPGRSWPLAEGGAPEHKYTAGIIYSIIILVQLYSVYILYSVHMHTYIQSCDNGPRGPRHTFQPICLVILIITQISL